MGSLSSLTFSGPVSMAGEARSAWGQGSGLWDEPREDLQHRQDLHLEETLGNWPVVWAIEAAQGHCRGRVVQGGGRLTPLLCLLPLPTSAGAGLKWASTANTQLGQS